jgi:hypothetical protein
LRSMFMSRFFPLKVGNSLSWRIIVAQGVATVAAV